MVFSRGSVILKEKESLLGSKFFMLDADNTLLKHNLERNKCDEVFVKVIWSG